MRTIEQQIEHINTVARRATWLGLVLGILGGIAFGLVASGWVALQVASLLRLPGQEALAATLKPWGWFALYMGLAVWYATFSLARHLFAREQGRARPVIGTLIGLAVFGLVLSRGSGLLAFLAPLAFAFLAVEFLYNNLIYLFNPVARYEDQIMRALASPDATKRPSLVRARVEDLQLKRVQLLRKQYERQLADAERAPTTASAGRLFSQIVQSLASIHDLPDDMKNMLGRAYLGLARYQAATEPDARRRYEVVGATLKCAQAYPLPPESIDLIALHYAAGPDRSPDVIKAFADYVRAYKGQRDRAIDPVYVAAHQACALNRADSPARLKEVEANARTFLEADDALGWAALRLGQSLLWQGQPREALPYLQKAVGMLPDHAEAILGLGQAFLAQRNTTLALEAFRRALALDPRDVESMFWLGYTLVADGRAERQPEARRKNVVAEARRHLEAVAAAQPERAEAYYGLGLAGLAGEDYRIARMQFEAALSLDPTHADWHYHYARTLVALQDFVAALNAARHAVQREPQHRPALRLLGSEGIRAREWAEAERSFQSLLSLDTADAEAHQGLGRAVFEQGRYAEAVEQLQTLEPPTRDSLYYLGRSLAMLGDFQRSLAAYQTAMARVTPDAGLCYALGCAHAHLGQYEPALVALGQSLSLQASGKTHVQRGHVYLAQDNRSAALVEYQNALRVSPSLPEAHHALGLYYYQTGDLEAAQQNLCKALQLDANCALAHQGLGVINEAQGDLAQAHERYSQALAAGGSRAQLLVRLGVVAAKREQYEAALAPLTEARQAGRPSDELLYYLGLAHARLSHWVEALEAWSALGQRHPDDERLRINIARCQYRLGCQRFAVGDYQAAAQAWEACTSVYGDDESLQRTLAEAYFRQGVELLKPAAHGEPVPAEAHTALKRASEVGAGDQQRVQFFQALADLAESKGQATIRTLRQLHERGGDGHVAYHLGFALKQAGQLEQAVPWLEQALRAQLPPHLQLGAHLMLADIHSASERWSEAARMYQAAFQVQVGLQPQMIA